MPQSAHQIEMPDVALTPEQITAKHQRLVEACFRMLCITPPELASKLIMKMADSMHVTVKGSDNWHLTIKGGTPSERADLQTEMAEQAQRLLFDAPPEIARQQIITINDGVSCFLVMTFES